MKRFITLLSLTSQLSATTLEETTTCTEGEYFNDEDQECLPCQQFTIDFEEAGIVRGDCPPIEYIEPTCTAIYADGWSTGRRVLCGSITTEMAALSLALSASLLL